MDAMADIEILRATDLAGWLGVSRATLYRWESRGILPPRVRGVWLARDILEWTRTKEAGNADAA